MMKRSTFRLSVVVFLLTHCLTLSQAQVKPRENWWLHEPYRLIQTNLREIDAIDFDIDVYVNSLKEMGANTVLINVGGIVCNYYTDLEFHYRNPHMKFNLIEEVTERLHQEGIRVMGRFDFSKLNEAYAEQNPGWLYMGVEGETVNYNGQVHTCINGGYQQEYSLKILDEALTRIPLDGVFFNMIGYVTRDYSNVYHGICQCDACRARFRRWSGGLDLPVSEDMEEPVFRQYQKFKAETSGELFFRIHDLIKSFGYHIAICTYTHAGTDFYRKESNSHSSFYEGKVPWEYSASHNVKSTLGSWKDKQVSNAAVHFYGYPARHSADARWLTGQRLFQNLMYGAGPDFYCIGRLDNLEDRAVLENVKEVFRFHKAHEDYFHHSLSGNRVLLLHDGHAGDEYRGIFDMLTESHILFDVMEHWCLGSGEIPRAIREYDVIVLPGISRLSDIQCTLLDSYVESGGKILATGLVSTRDELGNPLEKIRLKALGVEENFDPFDKIQGTYYRIFEGDKEALGDPVLEDCDILYAWEEGMRCRLREGATGYLGYIPPAMIGPPEKCYYEEVTEIPGLIHNRYGRGQTALITFNIGSMYELTRHYGHFALVLSSLRELLEYNQDLEIVASPLIEISRQIDPSGKFEWYGLLNHSGQLGNGFHRPFPARDIELSFTPQKPVRSVRSLVTGNVLQVNDGQNNRISVLLTELKNYDVLLVEYKTGYTTSTKNDGRIRPYPENPYYWEYKGEPVLLLGGSREDNLFNHPEGLAAHLDTLAACGGNYIRNTMSSRNPGNPWAFKKLENGLYDLNQWNPEYWQRFENLLILCRERNIVVQIEIWDPWDYFKTEAPLGYGPENVGWESCPFNPVLNINYTAEESGLATGIDYYSSGNPSDHLFFHTVPGLKDIPLIRKYQEQFVEKILSITLDYPNVLFCMNNEIGEPSEWGEYWARFIRGMSEAAGKNVYMADMRRNSNFKSEEQVKLLHDREHYDFFEISQNTANNGQLHYDQILSIRSQLADEPKPINNIKIYGGEIGSWTTSVQEGTRRFWRNIFGGLASSRFHRPGPSKHFFGIGLSELAQMHIRSMRMLTDAMWVFTCEPRNDLLTGRGENEAYCLAEPGKQYAVYFPDGGAVSLDVSATEGTLTIRWLDIGSSAWLEPESVSGEMLQLQAPGGGHWAALVSAP